MAIKEEILSNSNAFQPMQSFSENPNLSALFVNHKNSPPNIKSILVRAW